MVKTLALLLLVSLAFAAAEHAVMQKHREHGRGHSQKIQAMNSQVQASLANVRSFKLQAVTPDELYCVSAIETFQMVWNSSCSSVAEIFNSTNTTNQTRLDEVLQIYCVMEDSKNLTCEQKVIWSFNQFIQNCSKVPGAVNETQIEQSRFLLTASAAACLMDTANPTHFCIKDFKALDLANVTAASLVGICSDCTQRIIRVFDVFAPRDLALVSDWIKLICFEIKGQNCYLQFASAVAAQDPNANPNDGPTPTQLSYWCLPCVHTFIRRHIATILFLTGNDTEVVDEVKFLALLRVVCISNSKGSCFTQIRAANASFGAMAAACSSDLQAGTCSSTCHSDLQTTKQQLGCCFGTWFNLLAWQYMADPTNYHVPFTPAQIQAFVTGPCQSSIGLGCAEKKLVVNLVISNILWDYYVANKAKADADIKLLLAYYLRLDADQINDPVTTASGSSTTQQPAGYKYQLLTASPAVNGIAISTTAYPSTDDDASAISDDMNSNVPMQSDPYTTAWNLNARQDPSSAIYVGSASVTEVTSSARAVAPVSLAVLFAALFSFLLF